MFAEIIGWGKCTPPAVLTNSDLETFMDTTDEWIFARTGIKQRYISHVPCSEMARVASERAIACAGIKAEQIDLIVFGSNTPDEVVPNSASTVLNEVGAMNAAAFDVNSACTSFLYALNIATDMIKAGSITTALVVGVDKASRFMDWGKRESAVLFGDGGGAVVLKAAQEKLGLISAKLSCIPNTREMIHLPGWGMDIPHKDLRNYYYSLSFEGREIFKNAVRGMNDACRAVLKKTGLTKENVDFFVPHQANVRIIRSLAKRLRFDMAKVMVCVDKYANTSSGTIPLALCDALEKRLIRPGMTLLTATFGAGLTCGAGLIRWGSRATPVAPSDAELPPCNQTALELVRPAIEAAREYYKEKI